MALFFRAFLQKSSPALTLRFFHASSTVQKIDMSPLEFKLAGFYKYGLLKDDLLDEVDSAVAEAVRRLPEELQMQRIYRAIRASHAEVSHLMLPKEQWTTYEDDHNYLRPYLDEVLKERQEREEWEATH